VLYLCSSYSLIYFLVFHSAKHNKWIIHIFCYITTSDYFFKFQCKLIFSGTIDRFVMNIITHGATFHVLRWHEHKNGFFYAMLRHHAGRYQQARWAANYIIENHCCYFLSSLAHYNKHWNCNVNWMLWQQSEINSMTTKCCYWCNTDLYWWINVICYGCLDLLHLKVRCSRSKSFCIYLESGL